MQLNWTLNSNTFKNEDNVQANPNTIHTNATLQSPFNNPNQMLGSVVDFSVPWNLSIAYTLSFISQYYANIMAYESDVVQTISLRGDLNLTKNWKIAFTTGYDFEAKMMSYTSIAQQCCAESMLTARLVSSVCVPSTVVCRTAAASRPTSEKEAEASHVKSCSSSKQQVSSKKLPTAEQFPQKAASSLTTSHTP